MRAVVIIIWTISGAFLYGQTELKDHRFEVGLNSSYSELGGLNFGVEGNYTITDNLQIRLGAATNFTADSEYYGGFEYQFLAGNKLRPIVGLEYSLAHTWSIFLEENETHSLIRFPVGLEYHINNSFLIRATAAPAIQLGKKKSEYLIENFRVGVNYKF